jgi:hypothetical protein
MQRLNGGESFQPRESRHILIEKDEVESLCFAQLHGIRTVVGGGDIVSSLLEEDAVGTEEIDFIVDPKKACAHERSVLSVFPHKVRGW